MPNMASITVKKADEVTNIVYDSLAPAGGDGSSAVWRQDTGALAGLPVGHRAIMQMTSVNNGPKTARRVVITFKMPYALQNTTTTKFDSTDSIIGRAEFTLPNAIPAAVLNEGVYQFTNLIASALAKASISSGYSPS